MYHLKMKMFKEKKSTAKPLSYTVAFKSSGSCTPEILALPFGAQGPGVQVLLSYKSASSDSTAWAFGVRWFLKLQTSVPEHPDPGPRH